MLHMGIVWIFYADDELSHSKVCKKCHIVIFELCFTCPNQLSLAICAPPVLLYWCCQMAQSHQTCIKIGKIGETYSHGEVAFFDITPCFFNCFGCHQNEQFQNIPIFLVDFKLLKYHNYR
jgi:hypothetical protein